MTARKTEGCIVVCERKVHAVIEPAYFPPGGLLITVEVRTRRPVASEAESIQGARVPVDRGITRVRLADWLSGEFTDLSRRELYDVEAHVWQKFQAARDAEVQS